MTDYNFPMDHRQQDSEIRSISDIIRAHVMYQGEYEEKRKGFQGQLLALVRVVTGNTLDPHVPLNLEILLTEPNRKGLKHILAQGRRDLHVALNKNPEISALKTELSLWTDAIDKIS